MQVKGQYSVYDTALDIFAKIYYKNSAEGYVAPGKENESQEYLIRVQYY